MNTLTAKPAIVVDPEIKGGTPVFAGSRLPVETLFDYLQHGETVDAFLADFPTVQRPVALEALGLCGRLLNQTASLFAVVQQA